MALRGRVSGYVTLTILSLSLVAMCIVNVCGGKYVSESNRLDMNASDREFRAVWVTTAGNLDWPTSRFATAEQQQAELLALFDTLKALNFNAVIFQVRPTSDAFYSSAIDPWSVYLTGKQGVAPSPLWDPLSTAVAEAHRRGMDLHAWINPYIARDGSNSSSGLAPNHIANQLPQYAYPYGTHLWMDPGAKEVQTRILDTIVDIVKRYDVDGIHFDDFFYPYPVTGLDFPDNTTYEAYLASGGKLTRDLWRHQNVDSLMFRVSQQIKGVHPWVKFGISPFGIWKSGHPPGIVGLSSDTCLYSDSRKWLREGWVDYLSPQLYWKIDPPQQSFTALSDWWIQQNKRNRHLYVGCATYRTANTDKWPISEIQRQVMETRARRNRTDLGNIFFSATDYLNNIRGISDLFRTSVYAQPALLPNMPWLHSDITNLTMPNVTVHSGVISWQAATTGKLRAYALYQENEGSSKYLLKEVMGKDIHSMKVDPGRYALTAVDRLARESRAQFVVVDTFP